MISMKNVLLSFLFFIVAITALCIPGQFMEPLVLVGAESWNGWFPMVNLNHNAYMMWRIDHVSRLFLYFLSPVYAVDKPLFRLLVLFFGSWLLLRRLVPTDVKTRPWLWILCLLPPIMVLQMVGINPVVIGTLAWLPLLSMCCYRLLTQPSGPLSWILLIVVSIENCYSANQAAIFSSAAAIFLAQLLAKGEIEASTSSRRRYAIFALALIPAIATAMTAPLPPLPDYPRSGHVVPDDGVEGMLVPLIGPMYPFESIDRGDVRYLYGTISLYLLSLSALAFIFALRKEDKKIRSIATSAVVLALLTVLDTNLPESLATIAPMASVSRLVPWGTNYCLTAIAVGLAAWALSIVLISIPKLVITLPLALLALFSLSRISPDIYDPFLHRYQITNDPSLKKILCSPSAAIIRHFAQTHGDLAGALTEIKQFSRRTGTDATELKAKIALHPEPSPQTLQEAQQREQYWRWSTRRGKQLGDEVLTITFSEPITLRGIEINPGHYASDFPRGLRIQGGDCDQQKSRELYSAPSWQGSLAFTGNGYPYLTARNIVKVILDRNETVSCLFIKQTGIAQFDWSVTRVSIIQ